MYWMSGGTRLLNGFLGAGDFDAVQFEMCGMGWIFMGVGENVCGGLSKDVTEAVKRRY